MLESIKDLWGDGWAGKTVLAMIFAVIILIPVGIIESIKNGRQWEAFRIAHNCEIVSRIDSSMGNTTVVTGNGVGIGTVLIPGKTGWKCDDGITYYRWASFYRNSLKGP